MVFEPKYGGAKVKIHIMGEQENETLELAALEARLSAERSLLIEKTEIARTRVEAMIARLKAMESRS